jgi:hypothetical protein
MADCAGCNPRGMAAVQIDIAGIDIDPENGDRRKTHIRRSATAPRSQ